MLLVYSEHFFVISYSLITYACIIIAVYTYRATLVNLIYMGFVSSLRVLFICLNLGLNLQFISTYFFVVVVVVVIISIIFGFFCSSQS